ncbi:hypothetical protein GFK26_09005 [Variovorax paradoxus]|uniref:Uncharacterized protein n=1 Tax=Variovorax paradoxus TaxID=34073 RepID=A0A5Q0MDF3_VARPD|nr:hypothetical protein GFK26_09005 [Variovorax paradoxus]
MERAGVSPSPLGRVGVGHDGLLNSAALRRRPAPIPTFPQRGKGQESYSIVAPEACTIPFHFS